jgi:zinc transport system permease protein
MDDFLIRALLAGVATVLMTGGLGVFIIWRRMAYFGDTLSHAALLGVSLGILLGIGVNSGIFLVSILIALLMVWFQQQRRLSNDTLLGILAHSTLSLGLVSLAFIEGIRVDLNAWLFGDILAVGTHDLWIIWGIATLVLILLIIIWKPLLSLTVNEELAQVEGVNVTLISAIYTLLIALTIAVAMKIVGALLITSLLIIPAATARNFARTPVMMAMMAMFIGVLSVIGGLLASYFMDTPAGPSIVVAATLLFITSNFLQQK